MDDVLKIYIKTGAHLFFEINGSKVPFKVREAEDNVHYVVSLEDVMNKQQSDQLAGLDLWIPIEKVKSRHLRSPRNLRDKWQEYKIEDLATHLCYDIVRVEEFPQQLMAVIEIDQKEILIPLSEQLITEIDKANRLIRMVIPEGLLEL